MEEKAPHLNHVAVSDLELWMVDLPLDELGADPAHVNLNTNSKLSSPCKKLSSFFIGDRTGTCLGMDTAVLAYIFANFTIKTGCLK